MSNEITTPGSGLAIMGFTPEQIAALPMDNLRELIALKNQQDDRDAERSLADALAKFQSAAPRVHKSKKGGHGTFAGFDDVMAAVKDHLAANGLSVSFDTETGEGGLTATCHVMHRDGAKFSRKASVPIDTAGRMNVAQQMGSAISYAKRYAMTAALNIVTTDEDDDGAAAGTAVVTREQADRIRDQLAQISDPEHVRKFWEWLQVATPEEIPAAKFAVAEVALGRIIAKQEARA
jgi:hypothetical protein